MSSTEIYLVSKASCDKAGETRNAWRGAMYVWSDIAKRYFGLDSFPMFDESMMRRIWNAGNEKPLSDAEKIVLASTMDNVVVKVSDKQRLIDAFDEYAKAHPDSSIGEQSDLIKEHDVGDNEFIAWCQTTVSEFNFEPECDEDGEIVSYNDLSNAWDLFEQFDQLTTAD